MDKNKDRLKNILFFIIFLTLVVSSLNLLELTLRLMNYGIDTRIFIKARYVPGLYYDNLTLSDKYFSKYVQNSELKHVDALVRNVFYMPKPAGTLRGFLIGESSAQGFPYNSNQAFGKIAELALKKGGRYKNVEIINLGVSAMSSFYIRDAAEKIRNFEPDFILIYAGHNEYYGNISETTGGSYLSKILYVKLKELKIFQLVFNLMSPEKKNPGALMERQFNEKLVPKNDAVDRKVAGIFIHNIDKIVRLYEKRNIPVIVVEPVCNLLDMPPFSGDGDRRFSGEILKYINILNTGKRSLISEYYSGRKKHTEYNGNANFLYLDARCESFLSGTNDINKFISAKDFDAIPFRVRSELQDELREYCLKSSKIYKNLHYIPLAGILLKEYGSAVFGKSIFIDQLHFNQHGQRIIARIVAENAASVFGFDAAALKKVKDYFLNETEIDKDIYWLPAYKLESELKILDIVSRKPFTGMAIKFDFNPDTNTDGGLIDIFRNSRLKFTDPISFGNYYLNRDETNIAGLYFDSGVFVYPGYYYNHMARAKFEESIMQNPDEARKSYLTAYLLSEKNRIIYEDMTNYFTSINRRDWIAEFEKQYGKP